MRNLKNKPVLDSDTFKFTQTIFSIDAYFVNYELLLLLSKLCFHTYVMLFETKSRVFEKEAVFFIIHVSLMFVSGSYM